MPRASASIPPAYLAKHGIAPPKRAGSPDAGKAAENALYGFLDLLKINYRPQFAWGRLLEPPRRFVADAAVPSARLLIEIDGQVHAIRERREADLEKRNCAVFAGWHILAFTPQQAKDGTASLEVERFLKQRSGNG